MNGRVGRILRRVGLVAFLGPLVSLGTLYVIGWYRTPRTATASYRPDGPSPGERADIYRLHVDRLQTWKQVAYRLDLGLEFVLSNLVLLTCILAVVGVVGWYAVSRTEFPQSLGRRAGRVGFHIPSGPVRDRVSSTHSRLLRLFATVLAGVWLLVCGLAVVGILLGPAPQSDAPAVELDGPPAALGADAILSAQRQRHTVEVWTAPTNGSDTVDQWDIFYRATVDPDERRTRYRVWLDDELNTTPAAPGVDYYSTRYAEWGEWQDGHWRRSDDGSPTMAASTQFMTRPSSLRSSAASVVSDTESAVVIAYTSPEAFRAFENGYAGENGSGRVLVTIEKGEDPRLEQVVLESAGEVQYAYRYSEVGTATVAAPDRVRAPFERLFVRGFFGLRRLGF